MQKTYIIINKSLNCPPSKHSTNVIKLKTKQTDPSIQNVKLITKK